MVSQVTQLIFLKLKLQELISLIFFLKIGYELYFGLSSIPLFLFNKFFSFLFLSSAKLSQTEISTHIESYELGQNLVVREHEVYNGRIV